MEYYTKSHYDAHGRAVQTKQERAQGPLYELKKYHNSVKRVMITTYARSAPRLLDLACGRGGDLHKWQSARIGFVRGLDLSPEEIAEARRRSSDARVACKFTSIDTLTSEVWIDDTGVFLYDCVSCFFALHYFCGDERALHMLLTTVDMNLKPGGYFFGCVPDKHRILDRLSGPPVPHLTLCSHWEGTPPTFGAAYAFALDDTVTSGGQGSLEFLVDKAALRSAAARHGLHLVQWTPFAPPHPYTAWEASELFVSFAFKKCAAPAVPCQPRP